MARIIDGKAIAAEIREGIKSQVEELRSFTGKVPRLDVVLVGDDPASAVYVRMKGKGCDEVGMESKQHLLPESTSQEELLKLLKDLNANEEVTGILVQLPLPKHIDENVIINAIEPLKDVDGFHPVNTGKMVNGEDCLLPCTPCGCQELIARYVDDLKGKHLVVVGRSNIVGKPIANMMFQKNERANCTVTICHRGTPDISLYTREADILVVAAGMPGVVSADMVKEGAVVIDVGTNRVVDEKNPDKARLVGDVLFHEVKNRASAITPVPGGVGPMTITMLLKNTLKAFKMQRGME